MRKQMHGWLWGWEAVMSQVMGRWRAARLGLVTEQHKVPARGLYCAQHFRDDGALRSRRQSLPELVTLLKEYRFDKETTGITLPGCDPQLCPQTEKPPGSYTWRANG